MARQFPVVSVTGPRQSGKTTLVKSAFPNHEYVSLEGPDELDFAITDPKGFLKRFAGGVILDEIQRAPALLSYLQGILDSEDVPGRFIKTGSQQWLLMNKVGQTLAGRTAVVNLLPFSLDELFNRSAGDPLMIDRLPAPQAKPPFELETILQTGLYPRIHDKGLEATDWLSAYYRTYVERDIRDVANIGNPDTFQRFVRLCAGRSGQLLNLSSLAVDAGISHTTARQWISILQAAFIIQRLPPHHANSSKRLIKSPKMYFLDTGLLCFLLRIRQPEDIVVHAMKGPLFEIFVFSELFKSFSHRGETPPLFFWRDRTGHEVDLIIDRGQKLIPLEIKYGQTITAPFFDSLNYFRTLGPPASESGVLIHGGESAAYKREDVVVMPWFQCP